MSEYFVWIFHKANCHRICNEKLCNKQQRWVSSCPKTLSNLKSYVNYMNIFNRSWCILGMLLYLPKCEHKSKIIHGYNVSIRNVQRRFCWNCFCSFIFFSFYVVVVVAFVLYWNGGKMIYALPSCGGRFSRHQRCVCLHVYIGRGARSLLVKFSRFVQQSFEIWQKTLHIFFVSFVNNTRKKRTNKLQQLFFVFVLFFDFIIADIEFVFVRLHVWKISMEIIEWMQRISWCKMSNKLFHSFSSMEDSFFFFKFQIVFSTKMLSMLWIQKSDGLFSVLFTSCLILFRF